jgi:dTDP-4-dehydrorhamnose reductase
VRVLVTGAGGQLGQEVTAELERRAASRSRGPALEVVGAERARLDVAERDAVMAAVVGLEPEVIVHLAAFTAVDRCELEPERAFGVNAFGTRNLAEAAARVGAHLAYVSTDYVFDGNKATAYHEWDDPNPLSVYGRSKLGGERALDTSATIVRTAWVCGRHGANMAKTVLRLARESDGPLRFVDDQRGSPTVAHDLAPVLVDLALSRRPGVFHVTNEGATSWYGFARAVLEAAGEDPGRVEPVTTASLVPPREAPRPANSALDNLALRLSGIPPLRPWQDAVAALVAELIA